MSNTPSIYSADLFYNNIPPKAVLVKYPKLKKLFNQVGALNYKIPLWDSIDDAVLYAVIGQMLSFSAAKSIISRLTRKFNSARNVIGWASRSSFRQGPIYGVSYRKRKALAEWNKYALNKNNFRTIWKKMPLEDYRNEICSIWGFGRWASDMLAIFYVGRDDIWPESDTGIKKACKIVFGTTEQEKIKNQIQGYETLVSLYLWELINRKIQSYSLND